ncbi:MAG: MBL fold metallo-hydrolase [Microthrixaceae bacterium]
MQGYGGNTACVVLEVPGEPPIICDLGTGLRFFGRTHDDAVPFRGTALVSHLHWDHIQGLPFFSPVLAEGSRLDVYAPSTERHGCELGADDAVRAFLAPPFFPVALDSLRGEITVRSTPEGPFRVGSAAITTAEVPHCGRTLGYRIEVGGVAVAYVPDHQQPGPRSTRVSPEVLELVADVDLLIHDAQFDDADFLAKPDWGHCTSTYAVHVAAQAGARRLALFHHDPSHDDAFVDQMAASAQRLAARLGVGEVLAASEGLTVSLSAEAAVDVTSLPVARPNERVLIDR